MELAQWAERVQDQYGAAAALIRMAATPAMLPLLQALGAGRRARAQLAREALAVRGS
jgi:hypothetical protein